MEPRQSSNELPAPAAAPEQLSSPQNTQETHGAAHESFLGRNEQTERRLGHQVEAMAGQPGQPAALPMPVLPTVPTPAVAIDDSQTQSYPLVAADEDLIEKEWVDKAKQVIAETKDDPYRREQEVKKLQIEYVQKRYGKAIGATDD